MRNPIPTIAHKAQDVTNGITSDLILVENVSGKESFVLATVVGVVGELEVDELLHLRRLHRCPPAPAAEEVVDEALELAGR